MSQTVDDFLCECRTLIDARRVDPFLNDPDNRRTLDLLAYSVANLLQELKDLTPEDLFEGPVPDDNSKYPGEVFVFKKDVNGFYLYIKLKIRDVRGKKDVFVMSFHPDRP